MLCESVRNIGETYPEVVNFETFSPKTEMARRFRLKNDEIVLRENTETVNYQYSSI